MTPTDNQPPFGSLLRQKIREVLADSGVRASAPQLLETIDSYLERPARYIRPRLVVAAAQAYGAAETGLDSPVGQLSVATEMLHVFALLHDDRIDTPCRDGEFAPGTALLAGDLLYTVGYGLIAETVERYRLPREILLQVRRIAARTVVGQAADVTFRRTHGDRPSLADLYHLYDLKTGLYTIAAPLQIGALAAGCDPEEVAALETVAVPLGRAFQMRDDLDDTLSAHQAIRDRRATFGVAGADSRAPAAIPPWELNLAVTCAVQPEPIRDDGEFLAALEVSELERFVTAEIERLVGEALRATDHLALSSGRLGTFRQDLRDTLTSLTFPADEANTVRRNYGAQ